jgi:hypothetical protein
VEQPITDDMTPQRRYVSKNEKILHLQLGAFNEIVMENNKTK